MAEKRIGVRLVAEGGKLVKAELEGIGKAGEKSMGGLNNALTAGNARLGAFTKSTALALAAVKRMAIGFAAALGPGVLFSTSISEALKFETTMFRVEQIIRATGGVAGRSADQLREQARSIARATLESTEGVLQAQQTLLTFRRIQGDTFDRTIRAAADMAAALGGDLNSATMQLAKALENPTTGLTALTRSGTVFTESQKAMVKAMVDAGNIAAAQSFILSELEAQYGGTAVAAAQGLAGAQDGVAQSFQELKLAIADTFGLMRAATAANRALDAVLVVITENMGLLRGVIIATGIGLTVYFSPAIIAATIAVGGFIASLITLRGVLIATGIGAIVVLAGYLIDKFIQLVQGAGSFGAAMGLLRDVALEVWDRILQGGSALEQGLYGVFDGIQAGFYRILAGMQRRWADFLHMMARGFDAIPGGGAFAEAVSGVAVRAGSSVYETEMLADQLGASASNRFDVSNALLQDAMRPLDSIEAIRSAMAGANDELNNGAAAAAQVASTLDEAGDAGAGAGGKIKKAAEEAAVGWDALKEKLADYVKSAKDIGAEVGDALVGAFRGMEDAIADFVRTGKLSFRDMITSMIADLARLAARRFIIGPLASGLSAALSGFGSGTSMWSRFASGFNSFDGGGHTGYGPRSGGLDGKGGFLAMLHPRERVIDETRGRAGRDMQPVVVNIAARDAQSFRQSRTQVAADIQRAVAMGRRGM